MTPPNTSAPAAAPPRAPAPTARHLRARQRMERWWLPLFVGALLAVRVLLSVGDIRSPGLHHDETLFVNAAYHQEGVNFVTHRIGDLPAMVMPYIGALKSYLYYPIFHLLGVDPATVRIPAVLITSVGLLCLFLAVRRLIGTRVAVIALVLLSLDQSVVWLTRHDVGPSAIEFALKCVALLMAALYFDTRQARWVALCALALGLGVYNKLNFIWAVNGAAAVSVALLIVHRRSVRGQLGALAVWAGGLATIYAAFAAYYIGEGIGKLNPLVYDSLLGFTWPRFEEGMSRILDGTWFYSYALGEMPHRHAVSWLMLAAFGVGTVGALLRSRRNLAVLGAAAMTLLIAAQILVTPQATAGWHYIAIYPFVLLVAAYGVEVAAGALLGSRRRALAATAAVLARLRDVQRRAGEALRRHHWRRRALPRMDKRDIRPEPLRQVQGRGRLRLRLGHLGAAADAGRGLRAGEVPEHRVQPARADPSGTAVPAGDAGEARPAAFRNPHGGAAVPQRSRAEPQGGHGRSACPRAHDPGPRRAARVRGLPLSVGQGGQAIADAPALGDVFSGLPRRACAGRPPGRRPPTAEGGRRGSRWF